MSSETRESDFFKAVASRRIPRIRVAAIVIDRDRVLVQRPADDPAACYAMIGGEYEMGDSFEERIRKEFEEETTARVVATKYLFVVENGFWHGEAWIQQVEHYFQVTLESDDVRSREPHLLQHWLPLDKIMDYDIRPKVVRNAIASGAYRSAKYFVVEKKGSN